MARNQDRLSTLPDPLLIIIVSFLGFKEAARTCVLSKRWEHIWRSTNNVDFHESFFVTQRGAPNDVIETQRMAFINFVWQWMVNYGDVPLHMFNLSLSNPMNFRLETEEFIRFAIERDVKVLGLDFSDPNWHDGYPENHAPFLELPTNVYGNGFLESIKLFSCNFRVSDFSTLNALTTLSLGWIELRTSSLKTLLAYCPLLKNLSLERCWNLGYLEIPRSSFRMRNLVINKCLSLENGIRIAVPNLQLFQYSGSIIPFYIESRYVEEANLDFELEDEYYEFGDNLYSLLAELFCIKVLSVCAYILQVLPSGEEPLGLSPPLELRHLILKTAIHENEFHGISFMINSCPQLEVLSIEIGPARIFDDYEPPYPFIAQQFWTKNILIFRCIRRTLKTVEITGFKGGPNELQLLKYLINYGRVMQTLNVNISKEADADGGGNMEIYQQNAQKLLMFQKASQLLRISIS